MPLRQRIYLLVFCPLLIIVAGLSWYLTDRQLGIDSQQLKQRSELNIRQLSTALLLVPEPALHTQGAAFAALILEEPGVESIRVYDNQQRLVLQAGASKLLSQTQKPVFDVSDPLASDWQPVSPGFSLRHNLTKMPIQLPSVDLRNSGLSHIEIDYRTDFFRLLQYQLYLSTVLIVLASLGLGLILARRHEVYVSNRLEALKAELLTIKPGARDPGTQDIWRSLKQIISQLSHNRERELEQLENDIEQTTRELRESLETVEIQNIELDLARKEALQSSRVKSEFLANTTHELRTPLNGIIGFSEILLRGTLTKRQFEAVSTIQNSAKGLLTIINDILDFSRMESGKLILDEVPVNLIEVIDDCVRLLAPAAWDKGLRVYTFIEPDIQVNVHSDPLRLKQILTNLLNNAIKFTEQGHIEVRVQSAPQGDHQCGIELSVSDTGIGLSLEQKNQLFRAFEQLEADQKRRFSGTGLGLVITRYLSEQMGGEIGVDSEKDIGSRFWVSLPLEPDHSTVKTHATKLAPKQTILIWESDDIAIRALSSCLDLMQCPWAILPVDDVDRAMAIVDELGDRIVALLQCQQTDIPERLWQRISTYCRHRIWMTAPNSDPGDAQVYVTYPCTPISISSGLKDIFDQETDELPILSPAEQPDLSVLAVDDNSTNLRLLKLLLMDLGLKVDTCRSGQEALEQCQQSSYDHILLDLQMPGMDGLETASRLRQEGFCQNSQITLLSAHQAAMEQSELQTHGADAYLSKPVSVDALCRLFGLTRAVSETVQVTEQQGVARPIDLQNCLSRARGKRALAQEMLSLFLSSLPDMRDQLQTARFNNDGKQMTSLCHQLKGACSYTGVPKLREAVITLEMQCKSEIEPKDCEEAVDELIRCIDELLSWEQEYDVALLFED